MPSRIFAALAVLALCPGAARAAELPKEHFRVIGMNSPTVGSSIDRIPFWRNTIPHAVADPRQGER